MVSKALCVIGFVLGGAGAGFSNGLMPPSFEGQPQLVCSVGYLLNKPGLSWGCAEDHYRMISVADGDIQFTTPFNPDLEDVVMDGALVKLAAPPKLVTDVIERSEQCAISKDCQINETASEKARFFQNLGATASYWEVVFAQSYGFQSQKRNFLVSSEGELVILTAPLEKRYKGSDPVIIIGSYFVSQSPK